MGWCYVPIVVASFMDGRDSSGGEEGELWGQAVIPYTVVFTLFLLYFTPVKALKGWGKTQ